MQTLKQWDSSASWYDQNMGARGDKLNHDIIRPLILSMIGTLSGKKILDSGCGSGYFTAELAQDALEVIGTDFSPNFIDLCKKKYSGVSNLSFFQHNVSEIMPFENNMFDVALSKMVLQYVEDIHPFVKESYRVLKRGGSLVIVIDHPFKYPSKKYPHLKDYFDKGVQTKLSLWGKVELTWYPKTVSDYILPFIKIGLRLSDIQELPEEKEGVKIPRILALKFIK
ncbi:class I SAM-dependent methyltransferase [Candidatus Roizmanbacteria bacterium]|nr:class I SAM-dependent methyltransferase [Candidatus Roizmanbacteria bacterium]